jgi:hypothetical protein
VPLPLNESDVVGLNRYQLTVIASSMVDLVQSAGGWMCDRARAGWDVKVVVAGQHDARPLTILGAAALDVDSELSDVVKAVSRGGGLAVSARLLAVDDGIRADVLNVLKRGLTDVTVWGEDWPAEFGRKVDPVEHKLSSAARAFKSHALGAAAAPESPVSATETLFDLGTEAFRPLYSV